MLVHAQDFAHQLRACTGWAGRAVAGLNCLHRIAAAQELLRLEPRKIVAGYETLLAEDYCGQVDMDTGISDDVAVVSMSGRVKKHEACLAPIARGVVQFAASAAEAGAAAVALAFGLDLGKKHENNPALDSAISSCSRKSSCLCLAWL